MKKIILLSITLLTSNVLYSASGKRDCNYSSGCYCVLNDGSAYSCPPPSSQGGNTIDCQVDSCTVTSNSSGKVRTGKVQANETIKLKHSVHNP